MSVERCDFCGIILIAEDKYNFTVDNFDYKCCEKCNTLINTTLGILKMKIKMYKLNKSIDRSNKDIDECMEKLFNYDE